MKFQVKSLSSTARHLALAVGAIFIVGAAAALIAYVARFGLDLLSAYAALVVALAAGMLVVGGSSDPRRWRLLGIIAMLLCFLSFAPLSVAALFFAESPNAYALLIIVGLLLIPAAPFVVMVGRPRPESSTGIQAEGRQQA
ncbi:hypothetical protein ABN034_30955 [Actinopolymorpha sp. B11F2]|uniref:hypothetical protein n=1 Tax=Actinopolymorpha sp. B11F2 TaxID=3160862 RepID=UPI0032E3B9BA